MAEKLCFVIAPIGEEGSETRRRSDLVLKHVIRPAAKQCGYQAVRADEISKPGIISNQVIQRLVDDPLVIADLTGRNPNVFYEMAIRHVTRKPLVNLIQKGEPLPFDVAGTRTISLDHTDLDSVEAVKQQIIQQIESLEKSPENLESPISNAIDLQILRSSADPIQLTLVNLFERLTSVQGTVHDMGESLKKGRSELIQELSQLFEKAKTTPDRAEKLRDKEDLSSLGVTIQKLHKDITAAVGKILADAKEQQTELAKRIQNEFSTQSDKATQIVQDAFATEIHKFITDTSKEEKLLRSLVQSFMDGMKTMGKYQRINIEMETNTSILELEKRITDSINEVLDEVGELRNKVATYMEQMPPPG